MSHQPRRSLRGPALRVPLLAALLAGGLASAQSASTAPRFSAIVRAVLDDGTIALSLGSVLTPVRLAGVVLFPGGIPAITKALPVGSQVYVQIVKKGQPAMANVWSRGKLLQDVLLDAKVAGRTP